jgi:DTW domain-containing protein
MPCPSLFEPRSVCPRCRRPDSVCYCQHLTRIETETRIVLLQHPRERDMPIGTARMAHLSLPNSELLVGFDWENSSALARLLSEPGRQTALLFPGADALDLHETPLAGPLTLVVVDGTWANTKKMVRKNPILANLTRVTFRPARPSEYRIRREPEAQCVSTIEALTYVLGAIEGDAARFEDLLRPFRKMIDMQLYCKSLRLLPRSRHRRHASLKPSRIPAALRGHADNVVCVVGEANAWPCRDIDHRTAYPDELVQWVARRLATGETFEAFARPQHPLSPSTPSHLDVGAATLQSGEELRTLLERWRSFVKQDDIICSWGRYATALFVQSGGYLPASRYDLRLVAKDLSKRNIGSIDDFFGTIESTPCQRLATGRAGLRLGQLARIAAHFCSSADGPGSSTGQHQLRADAGNSAM